MWQGPDCRWGTLQNLTWQFQLAERRRPFKKRLYTPPAHKKERTQAPAFCPGGCCGCASSSTVSTYYTSVYAYDVQVICIRTVFHVHWCVCPGSLATLRAPNHKGRRRAALKMPKLGRLRGSGGFTKSSHGTHWSSL